MIATKSVDILTSMRYVVGTMNRIPRFNVRQIELRRTKNRLGKHVFSQTNSNVCVKEWENIKNPIFHQVRRSVNQLVWSNVTKCILNPLLMSIRRECTRHINNRANAEVLSITQD